MKLPQRRERKLPPKSEVLCAFKVSNYGLNGGKSMRKLSRRIARRNFEQRVHVSVSGDSNKGRKNERDRSHHQKKTKTGGQNVGGRHYHLAAYSA